jgi:transposase
MLCTSSSSDRDLCSIIPNSLLPLPPYSPELNPVEQLWQQIKQRFLSNTRIQIAADELL